MTVTKKWIFPAATKTGTVRPPTIANRVKVWCRRHWPIDEWLRWTMIAWLNDRYDDACWYQMCRWALKYESFDDIFLSGNWRYQTCTEDEGAFCGKCVAIGRLSR